MLLGDEPVIPSYTCFYQRMLAHDEREAGNILENALRSEPLVVVYDSILIPALTLVERDRQQGDLDEATVGIIRTSTFEMVDELGFRALEEKAPAASDATSIFPGSAGCADSASIAAKAVVIPIRDGSDDLVSTMLTQVLSLAGFNAVSEAVRPINETVSSVTAQNAAIVVLSGMPPVAMARANRLYRSLRGANPSLRIIVGIWNYSNDHTRAAQMISRTDPPPISASLADAVALAQSWIEPQPAVPEPLDSSSQLVTTPKDTAA